MKNFSCMTWLLQLIKIKPLQGLKKLKKPIRSYTLKLQFMFFDFAHMSITAAFRAASLKGVKLVQTKTHWSNLWGLPVIKFGNKEYLSKWVTHFEFTFLLDIGRRASINSFSDIAGTPCTTMPRYKDYSRSKSVALHLEFPSIVLYKDKDGEILM